MNSPLGRRADKMDKGAVKINLRETFIEARDWPMFRAGYFQLIKYLAFCGLYFFILYVQMQVNETFKIDEALRNSVVDEGGSLQGVGSLGDFFDYLTDQIMPNVFPDSWYNGEPLSTAKDEVGYVLGYNKLVGGLLITQTRGMLKDYCKTPYFSSFRSSYETFYPTCFDNRDIVNFVTSEQKKAFPIGTAREHPTMKWTPDGPGWLTYVPWTLKLEKNNVTGLNQVVEDEPTPPNGVNETRKDPATKDYYTAFTYSMPSNTRRPVYGFWNDAWFGKLQPQESDGAFRAFLKLSDGATFNERKIEFLKQNLWLDKFTRQVNIKFAVYNGMLSMFTFVSVRFGYSTTGQFIPFNTQGGTYVRIKSINMEPYRVRQRENCTSGWTPAKNETCYAKNLGDPEKLKTCQKCSAGIANDEIQLGLEVVFMIWLFYDILTLLRSGVVHALAGWEDTVSPFDPNMIRPGLKTFLTDFWTWLDFTNYLLFIYFIIIRISLINMILNSNNAVKVPINDYVVSLEYAADIIGSQLLFNFFNIVLCLLRTFKFYRFQPRLAIVNQTLGAAYQDLLHFLMMFMTFVMAFSVIAHILFGPELFAYSTFAESMNSIYVMMLTAAVDVASMSHIDGTMAVLFYLLYMFLVAVILLNVLLAILVDSYMKAKEAELEKWQALGYSELPNMISQCLSYQTLRHLVLSIGSMHEDLLLQALKNIVEQLEKKHECDFFEIPAEDPDLVITIDDIYNEIPERIRIGDKVTVDKIYRCSALQFYHEDEELLEANLGELHEEDLPLEPTEQTLVQRINELIEENELLHIQHGKAVASGQINRDEKHHFKKAFT